MSRPDSTTPLIVWLSMPSFFSRFREYVGEDSLSRLVFFWFGDFFSLSLLGSLDGPAWSSSRARSSGDGP